MRQRRLVALPPSQPNAAIRITAMFGRRDRSSAIRRIQRCWLRYLVVLVAAGSWLGPAGFGGSRWELAAFVVAFVAACVPLALRTLRPSVRLVNSTHGSEKAETDRR